MMIEWLIVGGGVHGTYLSNLLTGRLGVPREDVRVLDPHPAPLAAWSAHTRNCGMRYLRSPAAHNIDLDIRSLYRFAKTDEGRPFADFVPPYFRPSLQLFNRHCEHIISTRKLASLRIQGRAAALIKNRSAVTVELEAGGRLTTRKLILAIGLGEQPRWPDWTVPLQRKEAPLFHLFDPGFRREQIETQARVAVVGSGSSAVQLALTLALANPGRVTLVGRHPVRRSPYDFDPCWIGPKCMRGFDRLNWPARRQAIDRARLPGTLPSDVADALEDALASGRVRMHIGEIRRAAARRGGCELTLAAGTSLHFEQVILATGFSRARPGGALIDQAAAEFDLKCAACGYPCADEDLRWHEYIFVSGPLAELQIGPCARNIIGARNAGRRLAAFFQKALH